MNCTAVMTDVCDVFVIVIIMSLVLGLFKPTNNYKRYCIYGKFI